MPFAIMDARTRLVAGFFLACAAGCGSNGAGSMAHAFGDAGGPTDTGDDPVPMDDAAACAAARWNVIPVPAAAAADTFTSVAGTGTTDMWACSSNGQPNPASKAVHMLHWDGSTFTEAPAPTACVSLWASAPGELWAGGQPHDVDHLVDGQWLSVNLGDQREAFAIWGNRPSNVWFAGVNYNGGHWDGTALSTGVEGDAAILDLQGTALWGTGDDDLWILHGVTTSPAPTGVYQVNEAATSDAAYDPYGSANANAFDVDASLSVLAAVWAADDSHVWAVGSAGFIGFFDGRAWSVQASSTTSDLTSIWGSSDSDVWAVGKAGTIVHWDGSAWSLSPAPVTLNLLAVTGTGACNVWAVGEGGAVLALGP